MGLFGRRRKSEKDLVSKGAESSDSQQPGSSSTTLPSLLGKPNVLFYTVRNPWQWVMDRLVQSEFPNLTSIENQQELPTGKLAAAAAAASGEDSSSPPSARGRRRKKAVKYGNTLRVEVVTSSSAEEAKTEETAESTTKAEVGIIRYAIHGTSEAFDGLEDKDELVRTLQRCRCEHLELSPPSRLINWDVTQEECKNLVGDQLPRLLANDKKEKASERIAVLKDPMGGGGTGVFFVKNAEEINDIIEQQRKNAVEDADFLDKVIAEKGRIPSWVLQAEVYPCLLIHGRRKFHIRSYVVVVENLASDDLFDIYLYNRHEIRLASNPVSEEDDSNRERSAHITNGGLADTTERLLLHEVEELVERNLQAKVETFVAQIFGEHFVPDMARRISYSAQQDEAAGTAAVDGVDIRKFVMAGLDIMVTSDERLYLLEVNVNPAAPSADNLSETFQNHLVEYMKDVLHLLVDGRNASPNFVSCQSILAQRKA